MSRPALSPAQERAVGCAFADALVSAGAGSGKTRVLAERFVHLVRAGHVPLRRLAALTFTDKAAAEMRRRIAALLGEQAAQAARRGAPAGDVQVLEGLRADVEFAPIGTIHAFCARLLRQHAVEAGVDPSFQVLDAAEADLLREDAAIQAERRLAEESPELVHVLHVLAGDGRQALLDLLERVRGAGCEVADLVWHDGGDDPREAARVAEEALDAFAGTAGHLPGERRAAHAEAVALAHAALDQARGGDEGAPFLASRAAALVSHLKGPRVRAYSTPRKALEEGLAALAGCLLDAWGGAVLMPPLRQVLAAYDEAGRRARRERGALDFTDLELGARDLLRRARDTGRPLDLAPAALLVDEFQDTNPLQAEILALLREEGRGAPQFSVGDAKQGIYRFRRADVRVILEERARVGDEAVHPLQASYRACAPLIAGLNAIHRELFADGGAGVPYEPLEAAAPFLDPDGPVLELAVVDAGAGRNAESARELEAAWIAGRIAELVEGGTPRLAPRRDARGEPTAESVGPLRYGDVAVLFRAGTSLPIYEDALEARGIPFLTQRSRGFLQAEEIADLIHVLRVVHNPHDRFALACALTGPALAATDAELLRWFARDPQADGPARPWERFAAEAAAGGPHRETAEILAALRLEAAGGSLAAVVERALEDLGLYEAALLRPGGDRAAANLRKAVEIARRLDRGGRRGLGDLLRHLDTLRARELGEGDAPVGGEADDVVRLTTVHGAKGLEYPVVFVADVGRTIVGPAPRILFDGARGVAAQVSDPLEGTTLTPGGHEAIRRREQEEEQQESLRLLYVATTRAEERLVLSAWCQGATKKGAPKLLRGWGARLWELADMPLEAGTYDVELGPREAPGRLAVHVVDGEEVARPQAAPPTAPVPQPSPAALARAEEVWARAARPVAPLGHTRYVASVSELLAFAASPQRYYLERVLRGAERAAAASAWDAPSGAQDGDPLPSSEDPRAAQRAELAEAWDEPGEVHAGLDRAALGRAVHAVLEHVRATDEDVPASALERAVEEEGGDAAFAEAVRGLARRFLCSDLGARLRRALADGADVRREVALHARIRFPAGEPVGGFEALLVKGSIDLWLPTPEGVLVVDHKTNRRGGAFATPEALAEHYAWQLRLYALAAERALGAEVAGARLVLLDPGWAPDGPAGVEVAVDVSGPRLEETRRLCRAFARAELEGRYPTDWRLLLD